jgi:Ca2+-transporting ATPase
MAIGVAIQTIAIAGVTLFAFWRGLMRTDLPLETRLPYAETMAFLTLSASELLRAFTARSERYPLLKIGVFSNKWMNIAVLVSFVLLLAVIYVPFLNPIFQTRPLGWNEWTLILPLFLIPSIVAELTKWFLYGRKSK